MKGNPIPCLLLVVAVAALTSPALSAADSVPLALKFAPGEVLQYEVSFSGSGFVTAPDSQTEVLALRGNLSVMQRVVEVLSDGSGRLETKTPKVEITATFGKHRGRFSFANGEMRFFADGRESVPPKSASLQNIPLLMTPVTITVAPDGRTTGVTLDQRLLGEISRLAPQFDAAQVWRNSEPVFPSAPVAVGETWRSSARCLPFGPQMPIVVNISHTLDEYSEQNGVGLARISGFAEVGLSGSQSLQVPGGVSVSIPEIRETITSTEFFDTTKGQLLRGDYNISFRAGFSVHSGGREQSGRLESRLRVSVKAKQPNAPS